MALVVEDGTGVANANSFVTEDEIIGYAAARGVTIDPAQVEVNATKAMDYFLTLCLLGEIAYPGVQFTVYPRRGLVEGDTDPDAVLTIPAMVKLAQMQLALDAANGIALVPSRNAEPALKRRKTGPLEREYFEPTSYLPDLPLVDAMLAPLKCGQGGRIRTYRA